MTTTIKIHPVTSLKQQDVVEAQRLPLSPSGARVILGSSNDPLQLVIPVAPTAHTMFGPRGMCLFSEDGPLWVADTGHHRLLGWKKLPEEDGQAADWMIGQPDFEQEGQNAKGNPGSATVSVPTGICQCGKGMAVGDAWNHRVLIWNEIPQDSNVPADIVLGQVDFSHNEPNRGFLDTAGDCLHWPYGVFFHAGKLFVADTGNRRILIWNQLPTENGQPADVVLGQLDMTLRNENGGGTPTASSLRWGHSITIWNGNLVIIDAGNNRVMIWDGIPTENNTPCTAILGQQNFSDVDINQGTYFPSDRTLNLPYGITVTHDWLLIADTANSRLLGWRDRPNLTALHTSPADGLAAQLDFQSKGENRSYGLPQRDSLCWPYAIQAIGKTVAIADSGNNRILLWDLQ